MSSPAVQSDASAPRVLVLDADKPHDVFDVLAATDDLVRVRSPYLFEIGEALTLRIEHDGQVVQAVAVVRAHVGPDDARVTELEITERSEPRRMVSG
jgi:hypothetical protein